MTSENQRVFASVPEVQTLTIGLLPVREVQTIVITGAAGGTWTVTWPGQSIPSGGSLPALSYTAVRGTDLGSVEYDVLLCRQPLTSGRPSTARAAAAPCPLSALPL
jgi:hypothetical protein